MQFANTQFVTKIGKHDNMALHLTVKLIDSIHFNLFYIPAIENNNFIE